MYFSRLRVIYGKNLALEYINYLISRTFMTLLNLIAHWFFVFKAGHLFVSFVQSLGTLDKSLGRPNLASLYKYSAGGIIWIFITVINKSDQLA